MYELSHLCVDRTFLLIYWDPSCVKAGNMPFHLVVRCLDRGTHLLEFAGSILREKERHLRIFTHSLLNVPSVLRQVAFLCFCYSF